LDWPTFQAFLSWALQEGPNSLAERFFARAATIIDIPWQIAAGSDLRQPQLTDLQTSIGRFMNWYSQATSRRRRRP
jgi:hypothetical protein